MRSRILKRVRSSLLYVLYLFAVVAAIDYLFFYRPYVQEARSQRTGRLATLDDLSTVPLPESGHIDRETMKLLGKFNGGKASMLANFPQAKQRGTVRICCFGDSFTFGDEVDGRHDYPTLLQRLLDLASVPDTEVINFGNGAYGFHQSFIMWDRIGKRFDCDYNLFGPRGFQPPRDTTFGFIYDWSPYYLHARYVLDKGDVELVEVLGETFGERTDAFLRFVPHWRYLRYDRSAPIFLRALLPKSRQLENPFYYDGGSAEEEALETYRILLTRVADHGTPTLVGHHLEAIVDVANRVDSRGLTAVRFHEILTFPYVIGGHASPQGNDLLARQFLAHLIGRTDGTLQVLRTSELDGPPTAGAPGPREALSSYSDIAIEVEGTSIGRFVAIEGETAATAVDALVSLSGLEESVLDGAFIPLELELRPGMEVTLDVERPSGTETWPLGELSVVEGGLNVGVLKAEGFEFLSFKELKRLKDAGRPTPLTHGKRRLRGLFFAGNGEVGLEELRAPRTTATISIAGHLALTGEQGQLDGVPGIWFSPVAGDFRLARSRPDSLLDLEAMETSGIVEIVAEHWRDGTVRAPIARWSRTTLPVPQAGKPLAEVLAAGPAAPPEADGRK